LVPACRKESISAAPAPTDSPDRSGQDDSTPSTSGTETGLTNQAFAAFKQATENALKRIGSTIVRYGNRNLPAGAPQGTQVIGAGFAYASYYTSHHGRSIDCMEDKVQPADRGGSWTPDNYSAIVYPVSTGDQVYLPADIPPYKTIQCANLFVPGPTALLRGKSSCPSGWAKIYSGYLVAGHYSHSGAPPRPVLSSSARVASWRDEVRSRTSISSPALTLKLEISVL